jgi:hypothetical protein
VTTPTNLDELAAAVDGADLPDQPTLEQARLWLGRRLLDGATCPCCEQHAQVYKRPLTSSMAYVLCLISRHHGGAVSVHVPTFIVQHITKASVAAAVRGDFAKLRYWGLLDEVFGERPDRSADQVSVGYWRITGRGNQFVRGEIRVPSHVYLYNGERLDKPVYTTVDIHEALGTKFNYDEVVHGQK